MDLLQKLSLLAGGFHLNFLTSRVFPLLHQQQWKSCNIEDVGPFENQVFTFNHSVYSMAICAYRCIYHVPYPICFHFQPRNLKSSSKGTSTSMLPSHGRPFLSAEPGGVAREGAGPGMVGMPSELHRKLSTWIIVLPKLSKIWGEPANLNHV